MIKFYYYTPWYGIIWWPRRTLSVVHIDPDAWTPLPTCVSRHVNPSPDVHLAPTCIPRCVNPSPDVRLPDAWTPLPMSDFRRVNPSPDVWFPMCDTGLPTHFPNMWNLPMCVSRLVKHSDVPRRVRTSTLPKNKGWGVRYTPLANGADEQ